MKQGLEQLEKLQLPAKIEEAKIVWKRDHEYAPKRVPYEKDDDDDEEDSEEESKGDSKGD